MEKDLELYLEILNSERCLKKPKEAAVVLEKITKCFTQEKSQFTLGLLVSLLLNQDDALFTFIWKISAEFETVSAVFAAFKLLDYLVTTIQNCIEPYFPFLFEECLNLLNGKFAKVKEVSLKFIKNIIIADSRHSLQLTKLMLALEKILQEDSKIPSTILEQSYSLLGFLFEKYPETVKNEKWFFFKMLESLKQESSNVKNPSMSVIKGAFEGINGYLATYTPPDAETLRVLYSYIKCWSKFREDKKSGSRAALNILHNHWSHFSGHIYNDKEFWSINSEVWIKQKKEDRDIAFKFLCAFYSVMALFVKQKSDLLEVQNFLREFTNTLESSANTIEKKAALMGIKLFVLIDSFAKDDFDKMFKVLVGFINKQESRKYFSCLPLGIECISAFVLKSSNDNFFTEQLTFLQNLSVRLIDNYPLFESYIQSEVLVALEKSFYILGLGDLRRVENHIYKVLYQGLIRTSSVMTLEDLELLKETVETNTSFCYKSYLSLWKYLLDLVGSPNLPVGGSFALKKGVAAKVVDAFFGSFLKIISKLDFSIGSEFEPEKPSDIHIFINMVDLYQDLILLIDPCNLQKWLMEIIKTVIHLSEMHPLVSGFYKIAATSLKAADSIQLFDDLVGEKEKCFELVRGFLEGLLPKVDHFKGDLQVACLRVILAVPVCVVEDFVEKTVPALEVTTQLARNSSALLKDLIETLERWDSFLPSATSNAVLKKILPLLDVFLQSPYFRGNNSVDRSKASRAIKNQLVFNDSEFLYLQKKLLLFLGSLEMNKEMNLIELPDIEPRRNISDKPLMYSLPCCNGCVELNLEEIIPRVIDLAESCGDRKTRITACELLYSMVMLLMGNVNQLSGGYTYLFRKALKSCLLLGCDSDGLVCQIFEPLIYQIAHYLAGKQALNFSETDDFIDILTELVTCPCNPTVRDFSAVILREFTVWSIKQLTPEELKVTPKSVKRILEKIYSLALHPSHSKRLGAAIIFNKQYSVLREEDFILSAYWFELFYYFIESLRMCDGSKNVTEILEAIHHVERPLIEKSAEFNKESADRVVPPEFKGGRLCHLVRWTMERACDLEPTTRRTAMALVQKLAPLVENCDTNISFASKQLHQFFQLRENSFQSNFNQEDFVHWLKYQNAGFEYCIWLLEQKVLTTDEVFHSKFKAVLKQFIIGVLSGEATTVDNLEKQSIVSFLKLLYSLRERAYLYPPEHWDLLKTALFKPSQFGFDLNRATAMEELLCILTKLLRYFSCHLTAYDWSSFYKNLEDVITAPVFRQIIRNQHVNVECLEFLFALKVIEGSGVWETFVEKIFFSLKEDLFVAPIFKCLFLARGTAVYAVALEPSCKLYIEEILKIIMKVSTSLKGIMHCLENEEVVLEEETGKTIKKGEYFQLLFKNTIFGFLENKSDLLLEWVLKQKSEKGVKLFMEVLENSSRDSDLPVKVFHQWQHFENFKMKDETEKNKLLLHLAVCGARVIGTPGFLKTSPVADKIYAILESRKMEEMDIFEIEALINLLPFLSTFAEGLDENEKLSRCLSKIQIDFDGLNKSDDMFNTNPVHFALAGILQSFKSTGSLVILNFMLRKAGWFNAVCQKEDMESVMEVFGQDRTPISHSVAALQLGYWFCFECDKLSFLPSLIYKLFLNPLMKVALEPAVRRFMINNLESLCNLITTYWGENMNSVDILINIMKKVCAAGLIQTFVTKAPKEKLDEMPAEKRQLIVAMVRNVFLLLKKPYPPIHLKDRYRKLMCEIFNMICCILNARCKDEKFYKLFIFDERGTFLFETIDKTAKYNLDMDFDEIPKRKKHLTTLRKMIRTESQSTFDQNSVKYIQTNTLFSSSLQEDVTQFDLTFSSIRPLDSLPHPANPQNEELELEMDFFNSHDCMATLIATITKMIRDGITPIENVIELPSWLKFFVGVLNNSDFCENLKLFALKVIYNIQTFVAPFCEQIFHDLVDSILKLFENYPINYFLMDLIEMIVEWRHVPQEERSRLKLTKLVALVIEKSDSLRRTIVGNNVEILKTVIEVWKNGLYLPKLSSLVFKRLSKSIEEDLNTKNNTDSASYLNIQISGILLSNGIPAWDKGSEKEFFNLILKSFRNENKHNELFGKTCGLALNFIQETDPNALPEYEQLVRDKISSLPHCWLQLLYGVHRHHPKMSSQFTFRLFSSAWDSTDSLTVKRLEMLLSHVSGSDAAEDPTFERHAFAFLLDMLNSPDAAVHEISLQIAEKLLNKIDSDNLKIFILEVVRLQRSVSPDVRKRVYEVCKKLYQNSPSEYVLKHCKIILLKGLRDGVDELEKSCLEFWQNVLSFDSPDSALLLILKDMYASEAEGIFLSNAARILLQLAADDYRIQAHLFPHPITRQCKFQKRRLVVGTRQSFLLSLVSSGRTLTNQSVEQVATVRHRNLPLLRPTLSSLKFQPTVKEDWEKMEVPVDTPAQHSLLPTNPFKRRFYKVTDRNYHSFAWWRKQNKKSEEEKEEKNDYGRREEKVEILGEYRDGDYPDIQISHLQMTRLLEALSRRDDQIARSFLVSFFSGIIKTVQADRKRVFLLEASERLESLLKSSSHFNPGVFGFVLQVLLNHSKDFDIDCQLISNAAVSSNWISLGALIIEQIIANKEGEEEGVSEKRKKRESPEEKRWLELAKLYRSLEEFDILAGIFLDKLRVEGEAREAICCETVANWQEATKLYEEVLRSNSESDSVQKEFYTESYLACLAKLSNWTFLNKCIRTTVEDDLNELWNNYNLLSWFMKSEMMISLGSDERKFVTILQEFCKKAVKENILSTNFGEEMAVFDWFSGNLQRASYRIDKLCLSFLAEWSHLDRWSHNLRVAKLKKLQAISELNFAVKNLAEVSKTQLEQNIKEGLKRWEKSMAAPCDDLTIWDVKLCYRREFIKHLKDFDLRAVEVKSSHALAKAALSQGNLNLAKEYLSKAKEKLPEEDFDLKAEHSICFNLGKMVLAKLRMKDPNVGVEVYLNVWNGISRQITSAIETDSFDILTYSCNFALGQLVAEILPYVQKGILSSNILSSLCSKLNSTEADMVNALQCKGLEHFEAALDVLEREDSSSETKANTYLELSKFFLKFPTSGSFGKLCKYLLRGMSLGNSEARQLFGCVLNSSHLFDEEFPFDDIISECDCVPSWMFLSWINQMLASLNSPAFPFLEFILLRVTQDYPNAILYAVKLTEELKPVDSKTRAFFVKLKKILSIDKLFDDFWLSMKYLAPPDLILSHHLKDLLQEVTQPKSNYCQIKKDILYLQDFMFSANYRRFRGPVFEFWAQFEQPLQNLLSCVEDKEALKEKISNMLSSIESAKMPSRRTLGLLESYSPWLYDFHSLKVDTALEMPGQYDGSRQPIKKYLVTVSSFKNSVLVFDSKCRPMRIGILGNDTKEHKFLVKFGEDLRQDQRIQQVFCHFNYRLKESNLTSRFSVDTYKVIPLTLSLGMIEWVEGHVSLYEMIESSLGTHDAIGRAQTAHLSFLSHGSPSPLGPVAAHLKGYETISRERAVSNFKVRVQEFSKDLLKKSFLNLSTSPEHFVYLRRNFATSHATMCMTHWLMGIGDRHLQNTLVSTKTGRVLGIDFGYAFGFATQLLTPPELLPFRLSPQILSLMHPIGESGWIKQTMIHCLKVFRKESFRLQSVLEVFVQEPVMDWLKQTKKTPMCQSGNAYRWQPREKLVLVEKKLSGTNPVVVFEADLRAGHSESKYLAKYLEVLRGVEESNVRARHGEEGLSEEEEVECLIDLATDPHVLAKTYIGWNPWL